jgi:dihydrofolate reductase
MQTLTSDRKIILYIACSLDGYIAKPGDNLDFLSIVEKKDEDYGYAEFIAGIDTVILGRKTYDWIMKHVPQFVHADKETFVITRTPKESAGSTHFYAGDLSALITTLKSKPGKHVFIDGGAEIVDACLQHDLLDEIIISYIPVLVGDGVRLFKDGRPEQRLELVSSKSFDTGLVQVHYRRMRN